VVESTFFPGLVLDEVYEKFHNTCSAKNLTLSKHLPYLVDGFQIKADRALLVKVLSHLVDNAIKFTPYGHVSFGFELRGSELEFFVQDTGVGINKDAFVLIFDSFEQEDVSNTRSHEGSGLGLSIAKTMTEKMGGHIWFQSVKGEGSTFYFTIPCNLH
ncbi:MAG: ATP-binding protein, partial [Bacteroidota bacterium]